MSKGNMLLGYARGSVGDVTFSRTKGQQVTKARNRNPNNPKTYKQVYQRAKMASVVQFYKISTQNLFKYAFEDKRTTESDFNAFVRHNVNSAALITKSMGQSTVAFPVQWQVSQGSLQPLDIVIVDGASFNGFQITGQQPSQSVGAMTMGQLAQFLIDSGSDWENGDILTGLTIGYKVGSEGPTIDNIISGAWPGANNIWQLNQYILDTSDETNMVDGLLIGINETDNDTQIYFQKDTEITSNEYQILSVLIHSRNNADGSLSVSTQSLQVASESNDLTEAMANILTDAYVDAVMTDWGYTETAVLQGGLSE